MSETKIMQHKMSWTEVYERLRQAPSGRLYGVPRGGAIVAGLTGRAADSLDAADVVVDDIVDSGRTRDRYLCMCGKPFWSLVEKSPGSPWIVFPWEEPDPLADARDAVSRLCQIAGVDAVPEEVERMADELVAWLRSAPSWRTRCHTDRRRIWK